MLRDGDSLPFLRFKQTLTPSTHNAVYQTGPNAYQIMPVWIREADGKLFVETDDYHWVDPSTLPNLVRWELIPEEKNRREAEAAKTTEPQRPKNFQELQQVVEQQARNTLVDRYATNRATNSDPGNLSLKWAAFAEAGKRARDAAFRSK